MTSASRSTCTARVEPRTNVLSVSPERAAAPRSTSSDRPESAVPDAGLSRNPRPRGHEPPPLELPRCRGIPSHRGALQCRNCIYTGSYPPYGSCPHIDTGKSRNRAEPVRTSPGPERTRRCGRGPLHAPLRWTILVRGHSSSRHVPGPKHPREERDPRGCVPGPKRVCAWSEMSAGRAGPPAGCVPGPKRVCAWSKRPRDGTAPGCVPGPKRVCAWSERVCAWSEGNVCLVRRECVPGPKEVCAWS